MRKAVLVLAFLLLAPCAARAQSEWVTIKEAPAQCWQDVKYVTDATDFEDSQHVIRGWHFSYMGGDVTLTGQVLSERQFDPKKKHPRAGICIFAVAAVGGGSAANAEGVRALFGNADWQAAHMVKAQVETLIKKRAKTEKNRKP